MRFIGSLLFFILATTMVMAQDRTCGTDDLLKLNKTETDIRLERERFENWLSNQTIRERRTSGVERLDEDIVYQIPVVVHIINKGEPIGAGTNIPDEQVYAQIEALNLDFRHLNADSVNTPIEFRDIMADVQFEFVLAKKSPDGYLTNGITRTNGGSATWSINTNTELKALSYWPAEDYFNIWVAPLSETLLGWAEFPTSTIIPGVNEYANDNRLTDGVVVTTTSFGSKTLYPEGIYRDNFNGGRTLTHEVGHFFGLRHIWGDGDCSADDYVSDTPLTDDNYSGCPSIGTGYQNSCNSGELSMYMNYMDYVYDACMNLFSIGQKERMHIVMNNSPRRASLLLSDALETPPPLEIAIKEVLSPGFGVCSNLINPEIEVVNKGVTEITNLEVEFSFDGNSVETKSFNLSLNGNESTTLIFDQYIIEESGLHQLDFTVVTVNGHIDDNTNNNSKGVQVNLSQVFTSLNETFNSWPEYWAVRSDAPLSQWNYSKAPNLSIQNTSASLSYYQNPSQESDFLISPTLDLSGKSSAFLLFDYSYVNSNSLLDEFYVLLSSDCGNSFPDTLIDLTGYTSRSIEYPSSYSPSGPTDWQTIILDLAEHTGSSIQLAFVGKSHSGNNIYLDNIRLEETDYFDIALKGLVNDAAVFKSSPENIKLWIENSGVSTINSMEIDVRSDGNQVSSISISDMNLLPGDRQEIEANLQLLAGIHNLEFELASTDDNSLNNLYQSTVSIYDSNQPIPFRENFDEESWNIEKQWTISSPGDEIQWQYSNGFIGVKSYSVGNKGLRDWLVLPPFDFSQTSQAGLRFKLSYAENNSNSEILRIWASTNDGISFDKLITTMVGEDLITTSVNFDFTPDSPDDWVTKFIDLSEVAGEKSVLLAFELTDGDGNNLYLNDIDVFVSADPDVIELETGKMAAYPNPVTNYYSKLTFSLNEKQDIRLRIIDMLGNTVSDEILPDVLNQTFSLELSKELDGIYIIQAAGKSFDSTLRLMLNR